MPENVARAHNALSTQNGAQSSLKCQYWKVATPNFKLRDKFTEWQWVSEFVGKSDNGAQYIFLKVLAIISKVLFLLSTKRT